MRLMEAGRRRDVLIGQRGYVEPGGGVQIVDWRNAPVSRLFYRYEEGDSYEEQLGDRLVEGEVLARRTVAIVDAELRRVTSREATFARDLRTGQPGARSTSGRPACRWRATAGHDREGPAGGGSPAPAPTAERPRPPGPGRRAGAGRPLPAGHRGADRPAPVRADHPADLGPDRRAGLGRQRQDHHRAAPHRLPGLRRLPALPPERMLVVVYQRALATYVSRVLPSLDVAGRAGHDLRRLGRAGAQGGLPQLEADTTESTPSVVVRAKSHGAMLKILEDRQARAGGVLPRARSSRRWPVSRRQARGAGQLGRQQRAGRPAGDGAGPLGEGRRAVAAGAGGHRGDGRAAALAHARRDRRVGGAAHRPGRRWARGSSGTRPGLFSPGQLDELAPLVQRARAAARGRPGGRGRRALRPGRRGRRPPAAHLPAAARAPADGQGAASPTST